MTAQTLSANSTWLPIAIAFDRNQVSVTWAMCHLGLFNKPFFYHSVLEAINSEVPPAQKITDIGALVGSVDASNQISPSCIICHVSRCGSTLLANMLRTGEDVVVLSEASIVSSLMNPAVFSNSSIPTDKWFELSALALNAIVSLYASANGIEKLHHVVIKCHTANLLVISLMRIVWPTTPVIVLIRDPVEVMVSNLAKPSDWLGRRQLPIRGAVKSQEEYCAKALGFLYSSALSQLDERCRVVDYSELTLPVIYAIAAECEIKMPSTDSLIVQTVHKAYSKNVAVATAYENDSAQKRKTATPDIRDLVERYARSAYDQVKAKGIRSSEPGDLLKHHASARRTG